MQQMMQNFNQMSLQTGNGVNPLVQAQMMNELKYRRLYEEERNRNESLESKMTSLIDRIERHTENNMKIKAKYSKEIEHLRYQATMLERENEDFRLNEQRGGEGLLRQLEEVEKQKMDLQGKLQMVQGELEVTKMNLEEERRKQGGNPEREMELQNELQGMRMQLERNEEELKMAKGMVEEERHKGGRERNELEVERHKMELNIEHWKGQTDQMQREIQGLREMLDYEKGSKMRLEDRIRDLETRSSFRGWNGGNGYNQGSAQREEQYPGNRRDQFNQGSRREPNYNQGNEFPRAEQNKSNYLYNQPNNKPQPPKEEIVFGKPTFPQKRTSPDLGQNRKRSNSPFAVNEKLDIYGRKNGNEPVGNFRGNVGSNKERGGYGRNPIEPSRGTEQGMGSGMSGNKPQHQWNSARNWGNNQDQGDSGALNSIASKRMAVRRGRGKFLNFYIF